MTTAAMHELVRAEAISRLDTRLRQLEANYARDCESGKPDAVSLARAEKIHVADAARQLGVEPEVVWCALRFLIRV